MPGINYPLWTQLKQNIKNQLKEIAVDEAAVDPGRNFVVEVDRWRSWIESQQGTALVNILMQNIISNDAQSGSRRRGMDDIEVIIDMYTIGEGGAEDKEDEVSARRLDLLIAQVREGLNRLDLQDFGFPPDPQKGTIADRSLGYSLTIYDQESPGSSSQYAPARYTFRVQTPYLPGDARDYPGLDELNISVKDSDLELFAGRFSYPAQEE